MLVYPKSQPMKHSILILILGFYLSLSIHSQDRIYVWNEIEPGWENRSVEYWANVKGYGKKVPAQMSNLITEYFARAENELEQVLKKQFINTAIPKTIVFSTNPGDMKLEDSDLFLDLQCMILEATDVYPNYRSRKLNIEPVIAYKLTLYDAAGEIVGSREILDKVDYRNRIRHLVKGKSEHRRDIEIIKHSFSMSLSGPVINEIESYLTDLLSTFESKNVISDPDKLMQVVELHFKNRMFLFPDEYQDIRFNGKTEPITKNEQPVISEDNKSNPALSEELNSLVGSGHFYALIIGINEYDDNSVADLEEPVNDANRLYNTLLSRYIFEEDYMFVLTNPSRDEIIQSLDKMAVEVTNVDNLLIFYAGHGLWDKQLEKGFWLPSDAIAGNRSNWFSNSDLRDYIGGIKSKHTLVISDACFSGGLFKTRGEDFSKTSTATLELYKHPSRKAMTSGNMTMVPDKSVFIEYLIKRLEGNTKKYHSSEQLFASFKEAVINNSATKQIPKFGEIRESGDEGGDFLFILREK